MNLILENPTNMYNPQYDVITDLNLLELNSNNKLFNTYNNNDMSG